MDYIISDRRNPLLAGIPLCRSQELSMVSVWPQWWQPVGGPWDRIWDLVALVWPIRSQVITTSSALVRCWNFFVGPSICLQDRDLCHVQLHPTWFEPIAECRSWPVVSYLYSGHLPVGLYLGRRSLLIVGTLFHFRQCHIGLVPSRNEHVCPCHSMTRAGSWYGDSATGIATQTHSHLLPDPTTVIWP